MQPSRPQGHGTFLDSILATPSPTPTPSPSTDLRLCPIHRRFSRATIPPPRVSSPVNVASSRCISVSNPLLFLPRFGPNEFEDACMDPSLTVNPVKLGFIPRGVWRDEPITFGTLVLTFFRKRNSLHCKFPFKLVNALALTEKMIGLFPYVGVRWVTDTVLLVEKLVFAQLLGVRTVDGSFFHQQGNFPSHGFIELAFPEAQVIANENGIGEVDSTNMRFLKHGSGLFTRHSAELQIQQLKWVRG
jgi:hypothetical protein